MDLGIIIGIALIVIWIIGALIFSGPGWVHLLLTVGVFVIIWRIVVTGDRRHPQAKKTPADPINARPSVRVSRCPSITSAS
jgi:hypothetical protein